MGKPKAPIVDWVWEAWELRATLSEVPVFANLLMASRLRPLSQSQVTSLTALRDLIFRHLAYRMGKQKALIPAGRGLRWRFIEGSHTITDQREYFTDTLGFEFSYVDEKAIEALDGLGCVLDWKCTTPAWKSDLPLLVASIAAPSGPNAMLSRGVPRPNAPDRRSALRKAMERAIQRNPGEKALAILNVLVDDGVVYRASDSTVTYWQSGKKKTVGMDHFENVFTASKKAVNVALSSGRLIR